ncbi:Flp family type IVb pilin [Arthrobacter sp. NPDC056493]|uniref:Flp family type IVb pilin n=1 Tax=Arthrobacter sp. NPDC056493 TaxID=3345839 RepID=UPI0036718E4B
MLALFKNAANLRRDEKGATAVEYGIMVALIAVVIIVAVTLLGGNLNSMFNDVACKVQGKTYAAAVVDNPDTPDVNEAAAAGCR